MLSASYIDVSLSTENSTYLELSFVESQVQMHQRGLMRASYIRLLVFPYHGNNKKHYQTQHYSHKLAPSKSQLLSLPPAALRIKIADPASPTEYWIKLKIGGISTNV